MIAGVLCYSYLSCGKFCIQTRVDTGPQSPQLLHCMFTTVMEVSIKTGCKNTQVANYNHGLVALVIWAADCQVGGHWSGHSSTNKRGCITGFIITMAWLAQWLDNCGSYFWKSWFWTPSSPKMSEVSRNCGDRPFISIFQSLFLKHTCNCKMFVITIITPTINVNENWYSYQRVIAGKKKESVIVYNYLFVQ